MQNDGDMMNTSDNDTCSCWGRDMPLRCASTNLNHLYANVVFTDISCIAPVPLFSLLEYVQLILGTEPY